MQRDLYREVTDRIIASLEAGVAPWIRPWTGEADSLPVNAASHRAYRGINVVLLTLTGTARGYALSRWLTYRQAAELGGRVRGVSTAPPSSSTSCTSCPSPTTFGSGSSVLGSSWSL